MLSFICIQTAFILIFICKKTIFGYVTVIHRVIATHIDQCLIRTLTKMKLGM